MDTTAQYTGVRRVLLLGLGLILFTAMGLLIYGQLTESASSAPSSAPVGGMGSARQAFAPAARLAAQWQRDGRLAVVSSQWSAVGLPSSGNVLWTFQFFSPSTQRLALVVVEDGVARMLREGLSPYVLPTFSPEDWRVDSGQAWQTWWDRGGRHLMTRGVGVDVVMQLRASGKGDHPLWSVTGLIAGTDSAFTLVVDASDGTVLGP